MRALDGVTLSITPGRVRRGHGRVGLGQEHVHEHRRVPRPADLRPLLPRRGRRVRARSGRSGRDPQRQDRVRLPVLQPASAHLRARERRAAADLLERQPRGEGPRGEGAPLSGGRGPGGTGGPSTEPALGRAAAAGGDRPRADQRPEADAGRRADRQPRHEDVRGSHGRLPEAERRGEDGRGDHARDRHRRVRAAGRRLPRRTASSRTARSTRRRIAPAAH